MTENLLAVIRHGAKLIYAYAEVTRQALMDDYREEFANPHSAADHGYVDDVIEPGRTRERLIRDLAVLDRKRTEGPPKDHGNIQL